MRTPRSRSSPGPLPPARSSCGPVRATCVPRPPRATRAGGRRSARRPARGRRRATRRRSPGARRRSGSTRSPVRKSCMRTMRMRSLTTRRNSTSTALPAASASPTWNASSSSTNSGVAGGSSSARVCHSSRSSTSRARSCSMPNSARPAQGLHLEADAHLVEGAHPDHVGDARAEAAFGVAGDESFAVQPVQRLAHRGARHAERGGESFLAETPSERVVAREEARLQLSEDALAPRGGLRIRVCIHAGQRYECAVACSCGAGEHTSVADLLAT